MASHPALKAIRRELFASRTDGLISLGLLALIGASLLGLLRWAFLQAQWVVIQANSTLFAVGRYPLDQQWRLWLLVALLAMASGLSWGLLRAIPRADRSGVLWPLNDRIALALLAFLASWAPAALGLSVPLQARWWLITALLLAIRWSAGRWGRRLTPRLLKLVPLIWPLLYLLGMALISGGLGLVRVPPSEWGGLLLTVLMASFAILASFPLGVLMALGRRSELPLLRWGSVVYIEFVRGAPLITLLFLGQNILGFMLPGGLAPDRVWRAAWVLTFFCGAYVAEAVRAGLASVPAGQQEAARSLGLTVPQALQQVVLPQALRIALPATVGQFISLLQDTTLLSLIGLLELLGTARTVMANPDFLGLTAEVYLTLAVLFWCCCAALGLGSRALERRLDPTHSPA
ncbi:amino acid ABC transporter permease [Synechococcus sp. CS-603]|uniref:amino acid ABC transporter permease n=1 Tax=Synechococcus sp. CS-603 TaxID=2847981 RepID=UPI00223AB6D6|nr:amino acid ABC transporter permease [Synechococcus sp. CS-603]MCT0202409.1 amino acid ABC transporter permease [Synechococcus sp. CS-603]